MQLTRRYYILLAIIAGVIIVADIVFLFRFIKKVPGVNEGSEVSKITPTVYNRVTFTPTPTPTEAPEAEFLIKKVNSCYLVSLKYTKVKIGSIEINLRGEYAGLRISPKTKGLGFKIIKDKIFLLPTKGPITSGTQLIEFCFEKEGSLSLILDAFEFGSGRRINAKILF